MKPLYKTTIVIWSEYDPTDKVELDDLASDATTGGSYCSYMHASRVEAPTKDKHWDGTEFFGVGDEEDGTMDDDEEE
jgi:hypothetical protein